MKATITLHEGPMFGGKSEALVNFLWINRDLLGKPILAVTFGDGGFGEIKTRRFERGFACLSLNTVMKMRDVVNEQTCDGKEIFAVVIDEAQFFEPDLADLCVELRERGISVIVAGFDRWHDGTKTETIARIASPGFANRVIRYHSRCARCDQLAEYSLRLSDSRQRIELGDGYEPACFDCYVERAKCACGAHRPYVSCNNCGLMSCEDCATRDRMDHYHKWSGMKCGEVVMCEKCERHRASARCEQCGGCFCAACRVSSNSVVICNPCSCARGQDEM